jgi:DNA (cytosine-5)-methyltransferase 1
MRIRKLTPIECERLQGFPDGWTEGVSDTQRYKTLGNAVTVNVVAEIAKRIISDEKEELCITQIIQDTN